MAKASNSSSANRRSAADALDPLVHRGDANDWLIPVDRRDRLSDGRRERSRVTTGADDQPSRVVGKAPLRGRHVNRV